MFETELEFFKRNQEDLVAKYSGKVLILQGDKVLGVHARPIDAYLDAQSRLEAGTYMIQPCDPGPAAYTVTIAPIQAV